MFARMQQRTATLVVSVLCASGTLSAQEAPEKPASLAECAAIESAVARLDCFDALARRERGAAAPAQQRPQVRQAQQRQPAQPQQRQPAQQAQNDPREASESAAVAPRVTAPDEVRASRRDARASEREELEVTSRVAGLREIQPGRVEVTLANGQVWRQTASDRYNLLVGHEVRVYPSGFGQSFRLTSKETRGYIQVERVR
jgi:hypothetical protein